MSHYVSSFCSKTCVIYTVHYIRRTSKDAGKLHRFPAGADIVGNGAVLCVPHSLTYKSRPVGNSLVVSVLTHNISLWSLTHQSRYKNPVKKCLLLNRLDCQLPCCTLNLTMIGAWNTTSVTYNRHCYVATCYVVH